MQGVWVQSLVGELRSHRPRGQKKQNIKQKQYCNKFNEDFKNGPHQKNLKKKKELPRDFVYINILIHYAWVGPKILHFEQAFR